MWRIIRDTNHPSMNSIEDIYQPSAELARYHLRNAVSYLLQRPPVQGKAAIDWLLNEINSVYFPITVEAAITSFATGPLSRPTDSLVRNFIIVLTKSLLSGDLDELSERRYIAAIEAVRRVHRPISEQVLAARLNDIFRGLPDNRFGLSMRFLFFVQDTWQYVSDEVRIRINRYVTDMPDEDIVPNLLVALQKNELHAAGRTRLNAASISDLTKLISANTEGHLVHEILDIAISRYEGARNYYAANEIGRELIVPLAMSLSSAQIERIMVAGQSNSQVRGSNAYITVLTSIVESGKVSAKEMVELLNKYGLGLYTDIILPQAKVMQDEDKVPL